MFDWNAERWTENSFFGYSGKWWISGKIQNEFSPPRLPFGWAASSFCFAVICRQRRRARKSKVVRWLKKVIAQKPSKRIPGIPSGNSREHLTAAFFRRKFSTKPENWKSRRNLRQSRKRLKLPRRSFSSSGKFSNLRNFINPSSAIAAALICEIVFSEFKNKRSWETSINRWLAKLTA